MRKHRSYLFAFVLAATSISTPALAEWTTAGADVKTATADPRIAAALDAVNQLDRAVIDDDHAAFAALMADDLVVSAEPAPRFTAIVQYQDHALLLVEPLRGQRPNLGGYYAS
ncbi:MAG: hypothetical protein JWQ90_7 [Hydrocarboniphaga sp.]|uniref:hypothetical protein n=1 Tax=Hydrocarboniphaga sp. TaxID=2033016 RepID=UPI0026230A44|nr:hypothetical protein [Hydrocarboniphaga sp.]MDB5967557.1 hypothetical protein [Hydrocarboniphaga sp.]